MVYLLGVTYSLTASTPHTHKFTHIHFQSDSESESESDSDEDSSSEDERPSAAKKKAAVDKDVVKRIKVCTCCLLYTSPSPRD